MAEAHVDILARAQKRFAQCMAWESEFRQRFHDDVMFCFADSDNQAQWPANIAADRNLNGQPIVTINKTRSHVAHIVNQVRENCPRIKISPTGDMSTYESAQIFTQIAKRIEDTSQARAAYLTATQNMVAGGVGYWRLVTEYEDEDSFDQEIRVHEIPDALTVLLDPAVRTRSGKDAKFAFVWSDIPREQAEKEYGADVVSQASTMFSGTMKDVWVNESMVRRAEYFEKTSKTDWLYLISDDSGQHTILRSDLGEDPDAFLEDVKEKGATIKKRRVAQHSIRWYKIIGNTVVDSKLWPGEHIPIIRVVGDEVISKGKLDRKGLVRYIADSQRMYNYNASAALEYGALQTKVPWTAPLDAIDGLDQFWSTANTQNHAFLPYRHRDEQGAEIPAPTREQPPSSAPVYLEGMQTAEHQMMMSSGQYDSTFSEQANEVSGVSIQNRVKQGERATLHFVDAVAEAVAYTGVQIVDLVRKVYDTRRVLQIMAEDGEQHTIEVNPMASQAARMDRDVKAGKVQSIFNPAVGKYAVTAEAGPDFDTRREDAFNAMTQLLAAQPALAQVIGDIYMQNADFPAADKLAMRMRNWIPKAILGEGPSQEEQQLQQQLQIAQQVAGKLHMELQDKTAKAHAEEQRAQVDILNHLALRMEEEQQKNIDAFRAETDRLKVIGAAMDPAQIQAVVQQAVALALRAPDPAAKDPGLDSVEGAGAQMWQDAQSQPTPQQPQ